MTAMKYVNFVEALYKPYNGPFHEYCIVMCRRLVKLLYWAFDLLIILQRTGLVESGANSLLHPQGMLNAISLALNFVLNILKYFSINRSIKNTEDEEELSKKYNSRRKILFTLTKICCDTITSMKGTMLLEIMCGSSVEVVVMISALCSALISLNNLIHKQ